MELNKGLIVSCYADDSFNQEMNDSDVIARFAQACEKGGAIAIRTNLDHLAAVRKAVNCPVIGIKKVYKNKDDFRITPTMKEVKELVEAGADFIAIDATKRERYDNLSLAEFINQIKSQYSVGIIGDISILEEGILAYELGVDYVGTTLSGYTDYSENKTFLGSIPTPEPDYRIIEELSKNSIKVIAEGRFKRNKQFYKALECGATAVVIGSAISNPSLIVKSIISKEG